MKRHHHARIRTPSSDLDDQKLLTLRGKLALTVEPNEHGMRLDTFLAARLTWRSRSSIRALIEEKKIELKDRSARPSRKVQKGEEIFVRLPAPKRENELDEELLSFDGKILFEDRWLLALNKPPGIPVHPSGRLLHRTVITELHQRYRVYGDPERDIVPKLCHRLDLETSGVLLVAKDDRVVAEVGRQLSERETIKEYLAIVHGRVQADEQIIDAPIGESVSSRVYMRREVRTDGEPARTGVRVEQRWPDYSLVRIRLFTGRRHQIRVHLSHVGHPIVGDKVYGLDEDFFLAYFEGRLDASMMRELGLPRQALHAARIQIQHPIEKRTLNIEAPLPEDLRGFLEALS